MEDSPKELSHVPLVSVGIKHYNKTPLNISFHDICYSVRCKQKKIQKTILKNVTGRFNAGRLTAILGPSGAGKSTLLNILAGSNTLGMTGSILINEEERNMDRFKWQNCFIGQDDAMMAALTAHETLIMAAELKLSTKISMQEKLRIISDITDLLGISKAMDTRVANLSGGEFKRLSIAVELVTNPPVMFFDEPTSGLDSVSSCQVISHLRTLALGGRTIVCSIHQPSSRIFDMFDDLLVLADGQSIYGGPISEMVSIFGSAGFKCPQYYNRADFALEIASNQIKGNINLLAEKSLRKNEEMGSSSSNNIDDISTERGTLEGSGPSTSDCQEISDEGVDLTIDICDSVEVHKLHQSYSVSQWKQFVILFKRSLLCTLRDLQLTTLRVIAHGIVGLLLGLLFYNIGNDAAKIQSNTAFLYFILLFLFFSNSMPTITTYPHEAAVFKREHLNNWYSLPAYYFSKLLADLPLLIICPTIFMLVAYFMTGQPVELDRIVMVWTISVIFTMISHVCGLVCGVAFNIQLGLFLLPALTIPMLVFAGFFIRFDEVPGYMQFFVYLSYFGYGFEAMVQAIYGFNRPDLKCSVPFCFYKQPLKFLDDIDMGNANFTNDTLVLVGWLLFLQVALYILLKYKIWKAR